MMKLMRNDPTRRGLCKYALVRLDKLTPEELKEAARGTEEDAKEYIAGVVAKRWRDMIELGLPHHPDEFFAIKLRDENARSALSEYAYNAQANGHEELGRDVEKLAGRSGSKNHWCKRPD
jgi:hypothetical protein